MKWTGNPRPGLMAELKSVCRTVEKEVERLEQETRTVASTMAMVRIYSNLGLLGCSSRQVTAQFACIAKVRVLL